MYQKYYSQFLKAHAGKIHLAAHSHHFWPDITLEAVKQAWFDSAQYSDQKWEKIFHEVVPTAQKLIAQILNLSHPEQIAFAPNTHELLTRLLSCFLGKKKVKVLTTQSEFYSFSRQINRLKEFEQFQVIELDNEAPDFEQQLLNNLSEDLDLIFISHVFFNSGQILPRSLIKKIIETKDEKTLFCLDGYHGFCAIPTDLQEFENHIYYLAGGYKYAQAGEGACFLVIPKNCELRPAYTGWFASFETLSQNNNQVAYSQNGMRFWGATQDLTALYRFNAVWTQFFNDQIDIQQIHAYIQKLQVSFVQDLKAKENLLETDLEKIGHFLTLKCSTPQQTKKLHECLATAGVLTDYRNNRLRFGFGLYLDATDIKEALTLINKYCFIN